MRLLENNSIDLTITSPPYDNLRAYNGFSFNFEGIAKELYRLTKNGGVVAWVVNDATIKGSESGESFRQALYFKNIGFNLHDTMIYAKKQGPYPDKLRYNNTFEYMFILSKGKPKTVNLIKDKKNSSHGNKVRGSERRPNGELNYNRSGLGNKIKEFGVRNNVWFIDSGFMKTTKDIFAYKHPAMFPEQLANDHILSWSNDGDAVLDPFLGSGTTAKMAKINNRNYIGFEISEEYYNLALERIGT